MDSPLHDLRIGKLTQSWALDRDLKCFYQTECDSTNTWAKREAFNPEPKAEALCLYVTESQTAGRGRGTHKWLNSSTGNSLLSSWSYQVEIQPLALNTVRFGLALARAAQATWPYLELSLKAPNDLLSGTKKIAGLLIETVSQGAELRLIVGLGLNILSHPTDLPQSSSLAESMPPGVPLMGPDYICFLDRLVFEFNDVISLLTEPLSESECESTKYFLNLNPHLKEKYLEVSAEGDLSTAYQKTPWTEV